MQPATSVPKQDSPHPQTFGSRIKRITASLFQKHRKKKIAAIVLIGIAAVIFQVIAGQERGILVDIGEVAESSFEKSIFASGKLEVKDMVEFMRTTRLRSRRSWRKPGKESVPDSEFYGRMTAAC